MTDIGVRVQADGFDTAAEIKLLRSRAGVGAVVTFAGICRNEGGRLAALELEHFPGMAEAELSRIADEAAARWPLAGITVIHRHGRIVVGDEIVLVATASEHREAAFAAASFLMDYLKTNAPFWKREIRSDGSAGDWIGAHKRDEAAADKWR